MDIPLYWTAIIAFIILNLMMVSASVPVYAERKISGYIQLRPRPNRVDPAGFLEPSADVVGLVMKADVRPLAAHPTIHSLALLAMVSTAEPVPVVVAFLRG